MTEENIPAGSDDVLDDVPALEAAVAEPSADDPVADEPSASEPPADEPSADAPPVDEPSADEPPAEDLPAAEPPVEPAADPGLTGSIDALEPVEPFESDEAAAAPADAGVADAAETTVLPVTEGLTDAEAAALAASTLPAASPAAVDLAPPANVDTAPANVDMGPDERSRWWLWLLIGLLVLVVLGGIGYAWWWSTNRPISVPDVVGKQAGEAAQIFNDVGLRLGDVSEVATDAAPVGVILSQQPEAGTPLKPGGRVSFAVALPPTGTKVPEVTGKLNEDAQTELVKAKLRPVVVESFATTVAAGYVVTQLPGVGLALTPGSPVVLVVSKGPVPSTVGVPRVTGLLEADAIKLVSAYDLKPLTYRAYDASIAAGTALLQSPPNGTAAPYQSYVQVLISQGAGINGVTVPLVTGQSKASATKELKGKGLKTESKTISHATIPKGQVIYQMPPSGRKVATGSTVGLLVSRGNTADATVPSLVGTLSVGVQDAITKAGFRPVMVSVPVDQYTAGTVFMQFPAAGAPLTRGLPVVCLIAAPVPASAPTTPTVGATPPAGMPGLPATSPLVPTP